MNSTRLIIIFAAALVSCKEKTLFTRLDSSHTNIHFNNIIRESPEMNPLNNVNIYNGGGVGVGDFNGDGLQDLYFTGNMVPNKLYLNKGNFEFEDITETSKATGGGKWCRGVSVVDINNDGKTDLYISASMLDNPRSRENLLYVNQGNNANGIPQFINLAKEYGLNDSTHTTMAHFFDYDNDGDLDVYLVVNEHVETENQNTFRPVRRNGSHPSTGRLYRNDWNGQLQHGVFTNVSAKAGILIEGYGHAAIISDVNRDGWKDIYVSNDFISNNLLYINNRDGTFTDRAREYFKQTSLYSMGADMEDINNDGLLDLIELDMNPQDNYRKKMMLGPNSYQTIENFERYNYQYQYSRNSLQLNQGPRIQNDTLGAPVFSHIGFLAGISETDWSWTPLVQDFNNDGYRDLIITNGFPKDVTDHDFMMYRAQSAQTASQKEILDQVPEVKLHNYAFANTGDLRFTEKTSAWGFSDPSFSNGAVYADLDNDGDMDVVVNNINDEAFVYENNSPAGKTHFLNVSFRGGAQNINGLGAWVDIFSTNGHQVYEHSPYRGYLSSVHAIAHFGLAETGTIDSLLITWPGGLQQVIYNAGIDQTITVDIKQAHTVQLQNPNPKPFFKEVGKKLGVNFTHNEKDYIDFNVQKLLPHKLSEYNPALAAADVDGNGLDDIVCGGNSMHPAKLFLQQKDGKFLQCQVYQASKDTNEHAYGSFGITTQLDYKDAGLLLFDADGDKDPDLYIASGGFEHDPGTKAYRDHFYINNGRGEFTLDSSAIPANYTSKSCVRAADYDRDGDLDLFVAGRVEPWRYPKPVPSFIYRNDSQEGRPKFTDVTAKVAPALVAGGLICDALFSDFNNDGWVDLILAGEWMPLQFLENRNGSFKDISSLKDLTGWWNTIAPGDFDNDGDIDYIAGNLGLNSSYKASLEFPVAITAGYFDKNQSYDAFPSYFLPVSQEDTTKKEFPMHQLEDVNKQMISMRSRFTNFKAFANTTMDQFLTAEQRKETLRLTANTMRSVMIRNDGANRFSIVELPVEAQFSLLNGIAVDDYNADGNLDLFVSGNDFGTDVSIGRYDAFNGLCLLGNGRGNFRPLSIAESGIFIPGNAKSVATLAGTGDRQLVAASEHNGPLRIFALQRPVKSIATKPDEIYAVIRYKNGVSHKRELYYGYSFLSQSARSIPMTANVSEIEITDTKGQTRKMKF